MELYKGIATLEKPVMQCVATVGNFDGVHLGHKVLLEQVLSHARRIGGKAVVVTFRPHPHIALRPESAAHLLNSYEEKLDLLAAAGVDIVVEEPFGRDFSNTSARDFVEKYLLEKLGAKAIYLGYDFAFGKERSGSADLIRKVASDHGVEVHVVPAFVIDGAQYAYSRAFRCG
jgi:riboflavin kinase / FMN adenylyltransferase